MGLLGAAVLASIVGCTSQEVYFCPEEGCSEELIAEINAANDTCHVAIAYFNDTDIAQALIDAHDRGVEVLVLGEGEENQPDNPNTESNDPGINYAVVNLLKSADVTYRDDGSQSGIMHNKYTIIDGRTVLTGSFNYTNAADSTNNENLIVLHSSRIATEYEEDFQTLWANGLE